MSEADVDLDVDLDVAVDLEQGIDVDDDPECNVVCNRPGALAQSLVRGVVFGCSGDISRPASRHALNDTPHHSLTAWMARDMPRRLDIGQLTIFFGTFFWRFFPPGSFQFVSFTRVSPTSNSAG